MRTPIPPIAVVGVAALFPGSAEFDGFWCNVLRGVDLTTEVPPSHWLLADYYDPDPAVPGKTYSRRGGFLPDVAFDPLEYGITPLNLATTDSAQLLALVVAKQVLQDACGPDLTRLDRARTSVILGATGGTELLTQMAGSLQRPVWEHALRRSGISERLIGEIAENAAALYTPWTENTFPGLLPNVIAGRIANRFDLGGTNCATDAACASSLAALRMAVDELALGDAEMVVTGGVDAFNTISMYLCFSKTPAVSPSQVCRPFSAGADGTLLGEGLGMFALRRLDDAERDGNRIYAVLRGVGTSSDGKAKSVYAPVASGQARALQRAYERAGYAPQSVELVEAHGTGTVAGDAAEFAGLTSVFRRTDGPTHPWCALGSVKAQIGHTKAAAGAASLYKAVMALRHRVLPPTINVTRPNPALAIENSAFYLNASRRPWIARAEHPRRAAVSSFGFGGSNFHVTLEEYRGPNRSPRTRTLDTELFLLSAATPAALCAQLEGLAQTAGSHRAFVHAARRTQQAYDPQAAARIALVARDGPNLTERVHEARAALERAPSTPFATPAGTTYRTGAPAKGALGFLFPGQGSQYPDMGLDLTLGFELAADVWDEAATDPRRGYAELPWLVFPPAAFSDEERTAQSARLRQTEVAQPAIGITSLAYLRALESLGVRPAALAGHSFGELTALRAAGVFDDETFRALSLARGEVMADASRTTEGAMLAIFAPAATVRALLDAHAADAVIANYNAPDQIVVSGSVAAIAAARAACETRGLTARALEVGTAFHSPIVASAAAAFAEVLRGVAPASPRIPVFATATGRPYPGDPPAMRAQLARQLAEPVRFSEQIEAMYAAGIRTFVEVGPGNVLCGLAARTLGERPHRALPLDLRGAGLLPFWSALGALAADGMSLDTAELWRDVDTDPPHTGRRSPATVAINGTTYGKPYPVAALAAAEAPLPAPAAPTPATAANPPPAATANHAPMRTLMPTNDHPISQETIVALYREMTEALATTQRLLSETHVEHMRAAAMTLATLTGNAPSALPRNGTPFAPAVPPPAVAQPAPPPPAPAPVAQAPVAPLPVAPAPVAPASAVPAPIPPVPAAPPPVSNGAAGHGSNTRAEAERLLLEVVSQQTGYPVEMIDLDMDLEADLGIDSIKRVQILSAFRTAAPDAPDVEMTELAGLHTFREILGRMASASDAAGVR